MARCALTVRRVRFFATSCGGVLISYCPSNNAVPCNPSIFHLPYPNFWMQMDNLRVRDVMCIGVGFARTSEIPLRCCRRKRTVHEIRRGFFRWRKSDSDLPFWNRKTFLSPRT